MYRIDWKPLIYFVTGVLLILGLFVLLFPEKTNAQDLSVVAEDAGYHYVIGRGDTLSQHATERKAIEQALQWSITHPNETAYVTRNYKLRIHAEGIGVTDTVYLYDPAEPVYVNSEPNFNHEIELTNGIYWQFKVDSTQGVRLNLFGQTPADRISVGVKCTGVDSLGFHRDQRTGFSMTPDSNNVVQGHTRWLDETCNQFMTYWLTAYTEQDTVRVSRFVDVGEAWVGREQF